MSSSSEFDDIINIKHICRMCGKHFEWKSGLSRHMKLAHLKEKAKGFQCSYCKESFHKQVGLNVHIKQHQKNREITPVNNTGQGNTKPTNADSCMAKKSKVSRIYSNIISETVYSSDSDCEYEILQTVTKITSNFEHKCKYCAKPFVKHENLMCHVQRYCEQPQTQITLDQRGDPVPDVDNDNHEADTIPKNFTTKKFLKKEYNCSKCNKTFKFNCNLANHLKIHLKNSFAMKKQTVKSKVFRETVNLKHKYRCLYCPNVYLQQAHLDNHLMVHISASDKVSCQHCGQKVNREDLATHQKEHANLKTYLCTVCGLGYTRSSRLSMHMRTHTNFKPHLCSVCGKAFTTKRYLTVHQRIHTKERPFRCQVCSKGFIQKGNLIEHLRTHTGVKPHCCATCGKKFSHYSGLTQHLLTHSAVKKHVCLDCGKGFRTSGHYREHIRTHSGDRPFECRICCRRFSNGSSLVVHTRTHTGERPYCCPVCNKGFIKSYGLQQHKKTHAACNVENLP